MEFKTSAAQPPLSQDCSSAATELTGVPLSGTSPKSILLCTLNARYHHSSFGLRYLFANLKELQPQAQILEFTISQNTKEIVERVLETGARIVGFGVYIWNTAQTCEVVSMLKRVKPELIIVLGGPEVSYETETQALCQLADYTIKGEADFLFHQFCSQVITENFLPRVKWISGELPDISKIASAYPYYSDEDIRHRVIYVEASRGCPYKCEYCLSSLDKSVRNFNLDAFLADIELLIQRGARSFKFIDRTFNLSQAISSRILQFFLDRMELGLFLHFEMVPDRLPEELRVLIRKFPKGSLQFEIGIQTWNPEIAKLVSRRQDYAKIVENFNFLKSDSGVHTHADLIVGLPGEDIASFARGFDAVAELGADEIQVGILKRLKGTPIIRHDQEWGMVYQEHSPFQILQTKVMDFSTLQKMDRFSRYWDHFANSGNFIQTMKLLQTPGSGPGTPESGQFEMDSLFWKFFAFCKFLGARHRQTHAIALLNLVESAWIYLTENLRVNPARVREALVQDYTGSQKRDIPRFLRDPAETSAAAQSRAKHSLHRTAQTASAASPLAGKSTPQRQKRHLQNPAKPETPEASHV